MSDRSTPLLGPLLAVLLATVACGGASVEDAPIEPAGGAPARSTLDVGATLTQRAELAGVPPALAEAWAEAGVHISDAGTVWAEDCVSLRSVRVPAGVSISC